MVHLFCKLGLLEPEQSKRAASAPQEGFHNSVLEIWCYLRTSIEACIPAVLQVTFHKHVQP